MNALQNLFARYVSYHTYGPFMLRYLSVLGFVAIPLYYLLRFTKSVPVYDDWAIRAIDTALCVGLFLRDRWPHRLKPFYYPYSYLVLIIVLPMSTVFTSLHHGGGTVGVVNTMMAATLVMLLADWRNMVIILLSGMALGTLLYLGTAPDPQMPVGYLPRLPVLLVMLLGGSLIKHALELAAAERVRQAYASLAGSIAHEMRNPLGQLKYSLEAIQQALPTPIARAQAQELAPEQQNAIYRHVAQGELAVMRGLQVITMTLDEVHGKPMQTEGFQLLRAAEVCAKAVAEYGYEDASQRERVSLHLAGDFVFRGDETAFLFVLFNLIKNALAYPKLQVRVKVESGRVQVSDNGPGMAPQVLARLFEPFQTSGKKGGTGLGLAYCQRVMTAFGGSIGCASVLGQYTCFTMAFPPVTEAESDAVEDAVMVQVRRVLQGRRLLVVDDDQALRTATHLKLLPTGATVDECADGEEALAMLAANRYDLVILDLNMPRLDGYATTERIRAGHAGIDRGLRIVAHSSEPAELTRVKTRKAGMNDFVAKPCEQLVLLQTLCRVIESPTVESAASVGALAGQAVLLVDDNAYNRRAVAAYLRDGGAMVTEAESGQEALRRLEGMARCDAILMDIEMPGMEAWRRRAPYAPPA